VGQGSLALPSQVEARPGQSNEGRPSACIRGGQSHTRGCAEHAKEEKSALFGPSALHRRRILAARPPASHSSGVAKTVDWETLLVKGHEPLKIAQRIFRHLPRDPRCKLCLNPFGGLSGKVIGVLGHKPSRKNPNICQFCFDRLPAGGIEIDIGVVFADVRASTTLGEQSNATAFADALNEFYAAATKVLIHNDGMVDKLIGDEVMGLFIQGVAGPEYRRKAAMAAVELASGVTELPLGVAANAGIAFVGNVGSGSVLDFTALGDAVNVGARLQAHASPGEVVLAAPLYPLVEEQHPGGRSDRVAVRGRGESVDVVVLASPT
jgi:adenylate cyclase